MAQITLPARLEYLEEMLNFIRASAQECRFDEKKISEIHLAAEEALVNVINYAYPGSAGDLQLTCSVRNGATLEIEIRDQGIAFDPLSLPTPNIDAPLEERRIGGLGIYLIRKIMDEVRYAREGDSNILTMVKS